MQLWETQWLSAWIRLTRVAAARDSLRNRVTREPHRDPVGCGGPGSISARGWITVRKSSPVAAAEWNCTASRFSPRGGPLQGNTPLHL